jgi:hypothetical protein
VFSSARFGFMYRLKLILTMCHFRERLVEAFFVAFSKNLIMFRLRRDVISHNSRLQAIFGRTMIVFVSRLSVNLLGK